MADETPVESPHEGSVYASNVVIQPGEDIEAVIASAKQAIRDLAAPGYEPTFVVTQEQGEDGSTVLTVSAT